MQYRTIRAAASAEFVEKRSRFIGYISPVTTQQDAIAFIDSIKSKHWDATHNVPAYIIRNGNICRFSDDGEPQGTAGMPALNVLQKEELNRLCSGCHPIFWRNTFRRRGTRQSLFARGENRS